MMSSHALRIDIPIKNSNKFTTNAVLDGIGCVISQPRILYFKPYNLCSPINKSRLTSIAHLRIEDINLCTRDSMCVHDWHRHKWGCWLSHLIIFSAQIRFFTPLDSQRVCEMRKRANLTLFCVHNFDLISLLIEINIHVKTKLTVARWNK
jgi:hypothetical protein